VKYKIFKIINIHLLISYAYSKKSVLISYSILLKNSYALKLSSLTTVPGSSF